MGYMSTLLIAVVVNASLSSVVSAQYSFEQAMQNQVQSFQNQQNAQAAMANGFQNAKMMEIQRARAHARQNQVFINQRAWEKRRIEYVQRLEKHRQQVMDEWRGHFDGSDRAALLKSQMAVFEVLAGITTIVWAEDLKGKNNDLLYGAICPAVMEALGTELIKSSARSADVDEALVGPASVALAESIRTLCSDEDIDQGLSRIKNKVAREVVMSRLEELDPNLSVLSDVATGIDVVLDIVNEAIRK